MEDLSELTKIHHNSYIGLSQEGISPFVCCSRTWSDFHAEYVRHFTRQQRLDNKEYFKRFFKPELTLPINQIQNQIDRNLVTPIIRHIHSPAMDPAGQIIHVEQIHIHFTEGSALNIDGTWKHGQIEIPNAACNQLVDWGFLLPENLQ
ncbi:hypothetical protein SLH46_21420 [Draconibacterium sp. IB214405]|uniref:hypothetical protein n=1 Tax=Draconibacterium sp. IB214405 TaxID=3097352 RepID=UPI002A0DFE5B|nr:hypothetical protein [Draconibacterium sp. IB214405]MDX8341773.1 hypothetical protein [Draconibacterium sp. IB214405]